MNKKIYVMPEMTVVELKQQQPLLIGSYDGAANASNLEFGDMDVLEIDVSGMSGISGTDGALGANDLLGGLEGL